MMQTLSEGQSISVQGSGKNPYIVKMSGGVISCSCPAWRNQSAPIDQRTCKHIKANVANGPVLMAVVSTAPLSPAPAPAEAGESAPTTKPLPPNPLVKEVPCLLAHSWDGEQDVSGWIASPKLDGVRAWWDGKDFWSRLGNKYHAPQWFKDLMPQGVVLDGELFAGNGKFQETVSTVRKLVAQDSEWKNIKFMVFDMPEHGGKYEERVTLMVDAIPDADHLQVVPTKVLKKVSGVEELLKEHEAQGYEGIMLRQPGSLYESGRSHTLLKVKSFKDCEVTVTGYMNGKGKHKGRTGALVCQMDNGVEVSVGTGLSDKQRANPPSIGSKITIRYQELTKDGVPRFPSFVSARDYE